MTGPEQISRHPFRQGETRARNESVLEAPAVPVSRESVALLKPDTWALYRKAVLTSAVRIKGPFHVQTSEGLLSCEDGYLAVDARGYPYPIAADEFEKIYVRVDVP